MLNILNTVLPPKRNFHNSITILYGIGPVRARKLASILGLHPFTKIEKVSQIKLNKIGELIEKSFLIDFELKRKISLNLSALRSLKSWRGYRFAMGLPTRGQRTHTNASTVKMLTKNKLLDNTNNKSKLKFGKKNQKNLKAKGKGKGKIKLKTKVKNNNKKKK